MEPSNGTGPENQPGAVEVLQNSKANVWYTGYFSDIGNRQDTILVTFENDVWKKAEFPFSRARKVPRLDRSSFNPEVNEEVEFRVEKTTVAPSGWAVGIVRKIKHGFFFIGKFPSAGPDNAETEHIMEKDQLRPRVEAPTLTIENMKQENYELMPKLQVWATSPDAKGCFGHIAEQTNLMFLMVQKWNLKLFGEAKAIFRAKMLLEVHIKHQLNIQEFQDRREKGLRALESKRKLIEGSGYKHMIEIIVDPSHIPRIIGKGGEAIKALQTKHDVNVRIFDGESDDADRIIRIFGQSRESIEKARSELEYVDEALEMDPEMSWWVVGPGRRTIQQFRDVCGLSYAKLDQERRHILLSGPKAAVQEAVAMFETHMLYHSVFTQMDDEMEQVIQQLEEYGDYNARWEWRNFREPDYVNLRKDGKAKGKKGEGKSDGKVFEKGQSKSASHDYAFNIEDKGKGARRRWNAKHAKDEDEEDEEVEDDADEPIVMSKWKGGRPKGSAKGKAKSLSESDADEENTETETPVQKGQKGKSKGRGKGDKKNASPKEDGASISKINPSRSGWDVKGEKGEKGEKDNGKTDCKGGNEAEKSEARNEKRQGKGKGKADKNKPEDGGLESTGKGSKSEKHQQKGIPQSRWEPVRKNVSEKE